MPSDVTGGNVFNQKKDAFEFVPGPVFTQLLLADEINRAPAKTQSALLEAMQERTVTGRRRHAPAARTVLRHRHAEPDRVAGHLPAARGAARPVPVQAVRPPPDRREVEKPILRNHLAGFDAGGPGSRRACSA